MNWDYSTAWWVATGLLVVLELTSGTFYLLMVAIGTAVGALAAHAGLPFPAQLVAAAVIGGAAVVLWHRRQQARRVTLPSAQNPDLILDVGSRVQVDTWGTDAQARVHYRGAAWAARFGGSGAPTPGEHVIIAVEGPQLVLDRAAR